MALAPTHAPAVDTESLITPQYRHRKAVELHEMAIKHHKVAAILHHFGDKGHADSQAQVAYEHAAAALQAGSLALRPEPSMPPGMG